jgi:hypothetical protein
LDVYGLGPRVPFLVISPYALANTISHTQYEFSSVLKFIEERFGLPALTDRDANANDITDSFNFTQRPLKPFIRTQRSCPLNSDNAVYYGSQLLNTTSAGFVVTLSNIRSVPVNFSQVTTTGDFQQKNSCTTLPVGAKCHITVTFTPRKTGLRTGTLTITDDDVTSPQVLSLQGTGNEVTTTSSTYPGLSFGTVKQNSQTTQTVTLTNHDAAPLLISAVSTVGDFSQTNNCGSSVAAGASCNIVVTLTPTGSGTRLGNLWITSNDPGSPQTVRLNGTANSLSTLPTKLNFGNQTINTTSAPIALTLSNDSNGVLDIGSITTASPYAQTNNCGTSIPANSTCTVNVTFTPLSVGSKASRITITTSGYDSPKVVSLSGTGVGQ